MRMDEAKKAIEKKWVRLDTCCHELKELTAAVTLAIDAIPEDGNETAIDSLFVIRREMQRIADDMGEIVTDWQAHDTLED